MNTEELKPCPHCGHTPHMDNLRDSLHQVGRYSTDGCGKIVEPLWTFTCLDNEGGCNASVLGDSAEDCIKKWNTRTKDVSANEAALTALHLYADEGFYHGCSFEFDRPTGGFDEDFDEDDNSSYDRPMPGKAARHALALLNGVAFMQGLEAARAARLAGKSEAPTEHVPTNEQDAAAGNINAIRHIAFAEGYEEGKLAGRPTPAALARVLGVKYLVVLQVLNELWPSVTLNAYLDLEQVVFAVSKVQGKLQAASGALSQDAQEILELLQTQEARRAARPVNVQEPGERDVKG